MSWLQSLCKNARIFLGRSLMALSERARSELAMQQAEVEKKGFAILPEVLTRSDLDQLDESLKRDPLPRSRAGMRHAIRHPAVLAVARESRLRAIAQEVLGCDPFPFTATWFDKSTLSNWIVAWHQDKALPLRDRRGVSWGGPRAGKTGGGAALASRRLDARKRSRACPARNALDGRPERRCDPRPECSHDRCRLSGSAGRDSDHEPADRSRLVKVAFRAAATRAARRVRRFRNHCGRTRTRHSIARASPGDRGSRTLLHYPTDPMTQRYLEVALPVPPRSAFTYSLPTSFNGEELVGRRVLVPFRNRAMIGVGLAVSTRAPESKRIKEIAELLDRVPALPPKLIELGQWISRYYLAPIGEAFRAMLPPEVELHHHREYWLTSEGRAYLQDLATNEENTDVEDVELEFLRRFEKEKADAPGRALTETRVARLPGGATAAEKFVRRGHLAAHETTRRRKTRTQKIIAWRPNTEELHIGHPESSVRA